MPVRREHGSAPRGSTTSGVWRTGSALFTAQVIAGALGALAWLVAALSSPPRQVGTALALVGVLMWAGLVGNLGLGSTLVGLWPRRPSPERPALAAHAVRVAATAAGGLALVAGVGLRWAHGELGAAAARPLVLVALVAGGSAWAAGVVLDHVAVAGGRAGVAVERSVIAGTGRLVLLAAALAAGADGAAPLVVGWSAAMAAGSCVAAGRLSGAGLIGRPGEGGPAGVPGRRALAREGIRTHYLVNLCGQTPPMLLPVIVAGRAGGAEAAAFGAAWQLAGTVGLLSPAVATGLFAAGSAERRDLATRARATTRQVVGAVAAAALALIAAGPWLLGHVGAGYRAAGTTAVRLLALALLADAVTNVEVARLRVLHRFRRATLINGLIAVAAVGGAALLAGPAGATGAAVAWLLAQVVGVAAAWGATRMARRSVGVDAPGTRPVPGPRAARGDGEVAA